jgi:outer membrane protein
LQAEVRLATAKIDLNEAVKDYEKSLEEVKSLALLEDRRNEEVEGVLEEPDFAGTPEKLVDRAFRLKPEIILQIKEVERLASARDERKSAWYPRIDLQLQQTRQDKRFFPDGRSDAFIVNFTFPLFDGVGRYYNVLGAERDIAAAKHRLEETKRLAKLGIIQAYKDYELGKENVSMFRELVRDATVSFDQAFGEYKVGKGDVLTVLSSERDLAKAKENFVSAVYKANTALAGLERAAYLGSEGY